MTEQALVAADVTELMTRYSFDLGNYAIDRWIEQWLQQYPSEWLPRAVIEALYQGRYKAISVWQILDLWRRRGKPLQHFNREFERMVLGRSLQLLFAPAASQSLIAVPQPLLVTVEMNGSRNGIAPASRSVQPNQPSTYAESAASSSALILSAESGLSSHRTPEQPSKRQSSIQPFRPAQQFQLTLPGEIRRPSVKPPIQQFVPLPETSEFYDKLKAIAQTLLITNAQAALLVDEVCLSNRQSSIDELEAEENPDQTES